MAHNTKRDKLPELDGHEDVYVQMSRHWGTYLKNMSLDDRVVWRDQTIHYIQMIRDWEATFLELSIENSRRGHPVSPPIVRISSLFRAVDNEIESALRASPKKPICDSRCSGCCHLPVHITDEEVAIAMLVAKENEYEVDTDQLRRQKGYSGDDYFWKQPPQHSRCVFLTKQEKCAIYKVRPMACRLHISMGDSASDCRPETGPRRIPYLMANHAECINSAYKTLRDLERSITDPEGYTFPDHLHEALYELLCK